MNEEKYKRSVKWIKQNIGDFPQTHCEFMLLLAEVDRIQPKVIVEIGSRSGGSFYCFNTLLNPERSISPDLPEGAWGRKNSFTNLTKVIGECRKLGIESDAIIGDSHQVDTLEKLKTALKGRKIDFLFIDGDHTYEGVKQDFEMYSPLVRDGGIIGFYDIKKKEQVSLCRVDELWKELTPNFHTKEFVFSCGIGLLYYKAKEI